MGLFSTKKPRSMQVESGPLPEGTILPVTSLAPPDYDRLDELIDQRIAEIDADQHELGVLRQVVAEQNLELEKAHQALGNLDGWLFHEAQKIEEKDPVTAAAYSEVRRQIDMIRYGGGCPVTGLDPCPWHPDGVSEHPAVGGV